MGCGMLPELDPWTCYRRSVRKEVVLVGYIRTDLKFSEMWIFVFTPAMNELSTSTMSAFRRDLSPLTKPTDVPSWKSTLEDLAAHIACTRLPLAEVVRERQGRDGPFKIAIDQCCVDRSRERAATL